MYKEILWRKQITSEKVDSIILFVVGIMGILTWVFLIRGQLAYPVMGLSLGSVFKALEICDRKFLMNSSKKPFVLPKLLKTKFQAQRVLAILAFMVGLASLWFRTSPWVLLFLGSLSAALFGLSWRVVH